MKDNNLKIAAVSSYGTVSFVAHRYRTLILYKDQADLRNKLSSFLRSQVMMATAFPDFIEELEEVDINEGFESVDSELKDIFENRIEPDSRLVASILPILTDYHIELLGPLNEELRWLESANTAGLEAAFQEEGCPGEGEFLEVTRLYNPEPANDTESLTVSSPLTQRIIHPYAEISEIPVLASLAQGN